MKQLQPQQKASIDYQVGDVVRLLKGEHAGQLAVIYEVYERWFTKEGGQGVSLLTQKRQNLGGWEPETWNAFTRVGHAALEYDFTSAAHLARDATAGMFDYCFLPFMGESQQKVS